MKTDKNAEIEFNVILHYYYADDVLSDDLILEFL